MTPMIISRIPLTPKCSFQCSFITLACIRSSLHSNFLSAHYLVLLHPPPTHPEGNKTEWTRPCSFNLSLGWNVGHANHVFRVPRTIDLHQAEIQVVYIYYIQTGKIPAWNPSKLQTSTEGYKVSTHSKEKYSDKWVYKFIQGLHSPKIHQKALTRTTSQCADTVSKFEVISLRKCGILCLK
jgi:hypothetical protein